MWEAFLILDATRPQGWSIGAIQVSEIAAFCDLAEVEDRKRFLRLIRHLDVIALEFRQGREGKTRTAVPPKPNRRHGNR